MNCEKLDSRAFVPRIKSTFEWRCVRSGRRLLSVALVGGNASINSGTTTSITTMMGYRNTAQITSPCTMIRGY